MGQTQIAFRLPDELRDDYKDLCRAERTTCSQDLLRYIKWRLQGGLLTDIDFTNERIDALEHRIDIALKSIKELEEEVRSNKAIEKKD